MFLAIVFDNWIARIEAMMIVIRESSRKKRSVVKFKSGRSSERATAAPDRVLEIEYIVTKLKVITIVLIAPKRIRKDFFV